MQKIAFLINSLSSGGAERVVSTLLNSMVNKYECHLILIENNIFYKLDERINIIHINESNNMSPILKFIRLPFISYKLSEVIEKYNFGTVVSFLNRSNYMNIISNVFNKHHVIISERGMPSIQYKYGVQGFVNRILIKKLYYKSDKIIANSIGNSLDLVNNFNIENVITINNPCDIKNINKLSRENIRLDKKSFTFITIGRLDIGKNHQLIINAMKDMDAKLYIIGDGKLRKELAKQIKNLNLINKVFLLGHQKNPYKYLSKADCFVFSSNHEGFPNVLVEALACGLPVISTDCQSGPREILAPNSDMHFQLNKDMELAKYGILTPIENSKSLIKAMNLIMYNQDLQESYINKSKQRANDFNLKNIVKKYEDAICAE
jgi:N-acetylgalactosamine-N,N'-diacetylbacillosaminyl-diphospho-undecaprenol 4-alpha-N-acetylgalactosaminyltransferase